jgi:hypothetical protein
MPTPTYTPLATVTLGSNTSTVTFSNISQAYTDLVVMSASNATADSWILFRANPDTFQHNYKTLHSRAQFGSYTRTALNVAQVQTNTDSSGSTLRRTHVVNVLNYSATSGSKHVMLRSSDSQSYLAYQGMYYGYFSDNAAITSVRFVCDGANFTAGSTFSLFGVKS